MFIGNNFQGNFLPFHSNHINLISKFLHALFQQLEDHQTILQNKAKKFTTYPLKEKLYEMLMKQMQSLTLCIKKIKFHLYTFIMFIYFVNVIITHKFKSLHIVEINT